jgi:hypothetical protein
MIYARSLLGLLGLYSDNLFVAFYRAQPQGTECQKDYARRKGTCVEWPSPCYEARVFVVSERNNRSHGLLVEEGPSANRKASVWV